MGIGESAALGAAFLWTVSSFLWGRVNLSAMELNICKNLVGALLFCGHVGIMLTLAWLWAGAPDQADLSSDVRSGLDRVETWTGDDLQIGPVEDTRKDEVERFRLRADWKAWAWLSLSGFIGIIIGDTFFFRSLQILGPRRALMVATTAPLFAMLSGWLVLSEILSVVEILGITLTIIGVMVVIGDKQGEKESLQLFPGEQATGVVLGVVGAMCQGVGYTISKAGMEVNDCSPLEASTIRLLVAAFVSIVILLLRREVVPFAGKFFNWALIKQLIPAAAIGTWIGIWLSQVAVKHTEVGVAQTLISTSPLFAIPVVYFYQGQKTSAIAIVGTFIAIYGIWLTAN